MAAGCNNALDISMRSHVLAFGTGPIASNAAQIAGPSRLEARKRSSNRHQRQLAMISQETNSKWQDESDSADIELA